MTNFFFFIPIPLLPSGKENLDRPQRQKEEHRGLITCILVWVFILLLCLGWIFYVLNPPTGGYRNFEKIGTVVPRKAASSAITPRILPNFTLRS